MVKKVPAQCFKLDVFCEECKDETTPLKFIGVGQIKEGFIHKCGKCGHEEYLDRQFPCLTFEAVEESKNKITLPPPPSPDAKMITRELFKS